MNFYISDLHFGHYNVIHYANRPFLYTVKDNNIYFNNELVSTYDSKELAEISARKMSLKLMEETFILNWNKTVSTSDTVYVCGDFAFSDYNEMKRVLSLLNGKKILIEGNHDKSNKTMLNAGFDEVHEVLELTIGGHSVVLNHYPYLDPEFNRIAKLRPNIMKLNNKADSLPEIPSKFEFASSKEFLLKKYSHPINLSLDTDKKVFHYMKRAISTHIGSRLINEGKILIHGHTHKSEKRFANMINLSVEAWNYTPASEDEIIALINEYYLEIEGKFINEENYSNNVYSYYNKLRDEVSIFKDLNDLVSVFNRLAKSKTDPRFKNAGSPPKNYSKRWYDLNVSNGMFIPNKNLKVDNFYEGYCRNASWAYWDGECFYHYRNKFDITFIEKIHCVENDTGFDVFVPHSLKEISEEERNKFLSDLKKHKKE